MLSLASRQGDRIDLYTPLKKNIESSGGPEFAAPTDEPLKIFQKSREDLLQIANYRNDASALEKLAQTVKKYISMWTSISQSFTFGTEPGSVNVRFVWYDSYTREKKVTVNPITERISAMYNLAVIYSQLGANNFMSVEKKYKEASKYFLMAAWLFQKIKIETGNLKSPDFGLDFTDQNLLMNSYIMQAQCQYCTFEKVREVSGDKHALLAKVAIQASIFYGKAYSIAATPPICKSADPKNFVAVLQFHESAFTAKAHYHMSNLYQKQCDETAEGIGKSIAHITRAVSTLDIMRSMEKSLSPAVLTQFRDLHKHYSERKAYLQDQNAKIYHEIVPTKLEEIEPMIYGQPASIEKELCEPFQGQEVFAKLVPMPVKMLEEEFKQEVGVLMNATFQLCQKGDQEMNAFLEKHNLPGCLHAVSGETVLPEDLWGKVRQCKEKGGYKGLDTLLNNLSNLSANNKSQIEALQKQLQDEEEEDNNLRAKYGTAWNRVPSSSLNMEKKKQIEYYLQKFEQASQTDTVARQKYEEKASVMTLVDMDKEELTAKMPKPEKGNKELSPAAKALTELMKSLNDLKKEREGIVENMMKTEESENIISELFFVYHKAKDKKLVFDELKLKYNQMNAQIEAKLKQQGELYGKIDAAMKDFLKEKALIVEDPARADFFKSIDDATNSFNDVHNHVQQGTHFHSQLNMLIQKCVQSISDYVMSRTIEKNELVTGLNGQNFGSLGGQAPYVPQPSAAPPAYSPAASTYYDMPPPEQPAYSPPQYQPARPEYQPRPPVQAQYGPPQYQASPPQYQYPAAPPPRYAPVQPRYPAAPPPRYSYPTGYPQQYPPYRPGY